MDKLKIKVIKSSSLIDFEERVQEVVKSFTNLGYEVEIQYKPAFITKVSGSSNCILTSVEYNYTAMVLGRLK